MSVYGFAPRAGATGRVNVVQIYRTATVGKAPDANSLAEGELVVEMASQPAKLWVGVPQSVDASGRVPIGWSSGGGGGGGDFSVSIGDTPPATPIPGDLWWDSVGGNLYIRFNDGTSAQWVIAVASAGGGLGVDAPADHVSYGRKDGAWNAVLALTGDTLDGGNF
jgi:hypothetical protein